ncbi:hypothetical protein L249_5139 [Ophiocordyceps polyrhachis-furcata BCC 54312]|uniref:Trafficking protein particle complex subunit 10 n=1 Tax=Ophiocordyceps polyrhachis-furcata BCC 54312 TaxID=1330021 RepID=A0A367L3D2_9HYPO|nr:hypothetical protein L249_5139 [Ophiocordyceps polyrhachis-furcata BCC 54312]
MDQQTSTSTVTVEYYDPHNVYNLLATGLIPRLPLHNLHWQSHAGPLRSIETLHVELVPGDAAPEAARASRRSDTPPRDDGFRTQHVGGRVTSSDAIAAPSASSPIASGQRRHQIPGLRRTPYLKMLLVRCDDNESYKTSVRSDVREWIKQHTLSSSGSKKGKEKHDAFEWLIVHVVLPNTAAATQPRSGRLSEGGAGERTSTSSRWRTGTTPLMEKLRSDFNSSGKGAPDRVAQIRIGINDVPYDQLPRVVPAMPSGYSETEQDAENAWSGLMTKFKSLILTSFDRRVTQYEEDIKEKDAQRSLPGWNFCTFFILKEGLARGFESVGLIEDALVGYDELGVGLDTVVHGHAITGLPEQSGGAMLSYTEELKQLLQKARKGNLQQAQRAANADGGDVEIENLQSGPVAKDVSRDDIIISSTKKAYRDLILENKVSVFDFRCYIFSRQISLLLRQGNASSTREELLAKLKVQQESVLRGIAPLTPPAAPHDEEPENLVMLADVCRRTLEFIPSISHVMRRDLVSALGAEDGRGPRLDSVTLGIVDNLVSSFAFSVAQQILAQTWSRAVPIPATSLAHGTGQEQHQIPEPKTMMHPTRSSSLHAPASPRRASSPGVFPGPGRRASVSDSETQSSRFLKIGLEELAARRAELYLLSRSILSGLGARRGWFDGWAEAPTLDGTGAEPMDEVDLADERRISDDEVDIADGKRVSDGEIDLGDRRQISNGERGGGHRLILAGIEGQVLRTAMDGTENFYRLYEILTDKALRHYTVANYEHAVQSCTADLACLKYQLKEYKAAAGYFCRSAPFFGEDGWSSLEISMLIMYSRCLLELRSNDEFVRVALKLLARACAATKARLREKPVLGRQRRVMDESSPLHDIIDKLFKLAKSLPSETRVPLASFLTGVQLAEPPRYEDGRDACFVTMTMHSLLPRDMTVEAVKMVATSVDDGPCKSITFERRKGQFRLTPGQNRVTLECKSVVPGLYKISLLSLHSSRLSVYHEGESTDAAVFRQSTIRLFQRTSSLDVQARAGKDMALDKNSSIELDLSTGWNDVKRCELRVRPATGGLRLLMTEARMTDPSVELKRPADGSSSSSMFVLGPLEKDRMVTLRIPYSVEQDVADMTVKMEVTYVDQSGDTFFLAKTPTVRVSLAVGVNVQDVFKHEALLSRFNVSTATASPVYLHDSSLQDSDLFEASFGAWPAQTTIIFPKQPASLVYRVRRKSGSRRAGSKAGRTMRLTLSYTVLQDEAEDLVRESVVEALRGTPLRQYSRLAADCVVKEVRARVQAHDLERAALVGALATGGFLDGGVGWEKLFVGLGVVAGTGREAKDLLREALDGWLATTEGRVELKTGGGSAEKRWRSMSIPVEVPSVSVVHTADIRLETAVAHVNQAVAATLLLRWTRNWDTEEAEMRAEQEFSYEVTAPADSWLIGGRRRGRFVIPGTTAPASPLIPGGFGPLSSSSSSSSAPETEATIPLMLIPQREGRLPFPSVDVREVLAVKDTRPSSSSSGAETAVACEVDWRNLGETVMVVEERRLVSVSLDASGPGGGPLVLESEPLKARRRL